MADYSLTCVVDTSLLIDLHIGGILSEFFKLPYNFVAPNVILAELRIPNSQVLIQFGLQRSELTGSHILEVMRLRARYRQPSVNDLFALVTARVIKATLLTNDGSLRKAADQEGVVFHGTLWILDEMVRLALISRACAAQALISMCANGSRLPQEECDKRLLLWMDERATPDF